MKQQLDFDKVEQETVSLDRSVGNLFTEFLEEKNRLAEFDVMAENVMVDISYDGGKSFEVLMKGGFPAKVKDILKMVIKPTEQIRFMKRIAGG